MSTETLVVLAAARTPFDRFGGRLREMSLPLLGSVAVTEAVLRAGLMPTDIDELAFGINMPGSDRSIARQVQLDSGIPEDRRSYTVDRACCSSMAAISLAGRSIRLGESAVAVAGGAENLSRVPYFLEDLRWGTRLGHVQLSDQLCITCPRTGVPRAVQAGLEAVSFGVGREEQDDWALQSQVHFAEAQGAGRIAEEIVPLRIHGEGSTTEIIDRDVSPRPQTTREALRDLPTVYGSPTVTAGNAPGLSTGATALVLASGTKAAALSREPIATICATAMASGAPEKITSIPAVAANLALRAAGLSLADVHLLEVNEAFAAVPLVTTLLLADFDKHRTELLRRVTNVNGGAIAVGHPTGASGARLVMTLAGELRRRGGGIGLATICGGIGEAEAIVLRLG